MDPPLFTVEELLLVSLPDCSVGLRKREARSAP